eukprot:6456862-Pyramimonas_sp.AAC.1
MGMGAGCRTLRKGSWEEGRLLGGGLAMAHRSRIGRERSPSAPIWQHAPTVASPPLSSTSS